jgi:hypothetical protein
LTYTNKGSHEDTVIRSAIDVDVIEFAILCDRAHMENAEVMRQIHDQKRAVVAAEESLLQLMGNLYCM